MTDSTSSYFKSVADELPYEEPRQRSLRCLQRYRARVSEEAELEWFRVVANSRQLPLREHSRDRNLKLVDGDIGIGRRLSE